MKSFISIPTEGAVARLLDANRSAPMRQAPRAVIQSGTMPTSIASE
ncbi:MAG: hypothetical protein V8T46_11215 [Sutterella seckii]